MTTHSPSSGHLAEDSGLEKMKQRFLSKLLDPLDRFVEAIYTVLIILTFTLAVRVADAYANSSVVSGLVEQLFWACLGCAVAWGLIDGVMYMLSSMAERGQNLRLARTIQNAPNEEVAIAALADEMDDRLSPVADEDERRRLYAQLVSQTREAPLPAAAGIKREDIAGAFGIFLVALGAALPVALPLLIFSSNATVAVRVSNLVAGLMLFGMGYRWAQYAGGRPLRSGLFLVFIAVALMIVAIPLGG